MDKPTISPAGDPFYAEAQKRPEHDPAPHGCYDGYVFVGHLEITEEGEELEIIEARPCRRCGA
jgi:hypothetical protein